MDGEAHPQSAEQVLKSGLHGQTSCPRSSPARKVSHRHVSTVNAARARRSMPFASICLLQRPFPTAWILPHEEHTHSRQLLAPPCQGEGQAAYLVCQHGEPSLQCFLVEEEEKRQTEQRFAPPSPRALAEPSLDSSRDLQLSAIRNTVTLSKASVSKRDSSLVSAGRALCTS